MNIKDKKIFNFEGHLSSSKSLVNRALLLQAVLGEDCPLHFEWESKALDVIYLEKALKNLKQNNTFQVGQGGTTFRFLAVFLSSQPGNWEIQGDESLFKRPHSDLIEFLDFQKVDFKMSNHSLKISSQGWLHKKNIKVSSLKTTQVLTAVVICSLAFDHDFCIHVNGQQESDYFNLTLKFLKDCGYEITFKEKTLQIIRKIQKTNEKRHAEILKLSIDADWSTASFLFVMGALCGHCCVKNLNYNDSQPDSIILEVLKSSGVDVASKKNATNKKNGDLKKNSVTFKNRAKHTGQNINLRLFPDLFPVLSVFFAFANGPSKLYGAPSLTLKETDRINEVYKILSLCGYKVEKLKDGIAIQGEGDHVLEHKPFEFDCSKDHRIFMSAYILKRKGYNISILGSESINKSFPEFFKLVGEL